MPLRGGPFSFDVLATTPSGSASQRLTYGNEGAVYRIFNSSDRTDPSDKRLRITNERKAGAYVPVPSAAQAQALFPTMSIDIAVGPSDDVSMHPVGLRIENAVSPATDAKLTGVFNLVRDKRGQLSETRRSGRFNFPPRVPNNFLPVLLVDLTHSNIAAVYRFFNTGEKTFELFVAENRTGTKHWTHQLAEKQSIEIEIPVNSVKRIFVARIPNNDSIKGVFDLVG